jgi:hypothetical protein
MRADLWWWNVQDRVRVEDIGVGGRIVFEGVDWIYLVQDTEELLTVVNMVMDLWVP